MPQKQSVKKSASITKKALKKVAVKIKKDNDKLSKATPAQKRVMIAKDVLKLLATKKVKPMRGIYVVPARLQNGEVPSDKFLAKAEDKKKELREVLPTCHACALGSAFIAYARVFDNISVGKAMAREDRWDSSPHGLREVSGIFAYETLEKVFPHQMLKDIEEVFEHPANYVGYVGRRPGVVLKKIMENIITNKGEFVMPPNHGMSRVFG